VALIFALATSCMAPALAQVTRQTIANYRFEPGADFLSDSSPNGRDLVQGTGAATQVQSVADAPPGVVSNGSAFFDGTAVAVTAAALNLQQLIANDANPLRRRLEISWYQRLQTPTDRRVVFEHSINFAELPGAFSVGVNSIYNGTPPAPPQRGFLAYRPLPLVNVPIPDDGIQLPPGSSVRAFPHADAVAPPGGQWQQFRLVIAGTSNGGTSLQMLDENGVQISTFLSASGGAIRFANSRFFIGARGLSAELGFIGNIDELLIENVVISPDTPVGPVGPVGPIGPIGPIGDFPGVFPLAFAGVGPGTADGVIVDAKGVLRMKHFDDPGNEMLLKRIASARANLNPQLAQPSRLRKVSLNRLEAAVRARLEMKQPPTEEMQFLAGLTRVRYLFYYPETKDIVLAGPAEGWAHDAVDTPRALRSSRPILQLQDLIVALRAFPPSGKSSGAILVSIDPTAEGLSRMQEFLRSVGSHATPDDTDGIVNGLRNSLGMQNVRVQGVPPSTHFAKVLLECDYRMKLIGIGLERPPVKIVSFIDRAKGGSNKALQRWYFTPDYHCARMAADGLGLQLVGDVVKLIGEDQLVDGKGTRSVTGGKNGASDVFTNSFTKRYAELATAVPVFAEMRNCIDLAIVAAFIQKQDFYQKAGWAAETFNDEGALKVETADVPQHTETVVTAVWKGNRLLTPVGGGVTVYPRQALQASNLLTDEDGRVTALRETVNLKDLPPHRWWWD